MAPNMFLTSPASLDDLAWAISSDGIAAHVGELRGVAVTARRSGVCTRLIEVLVDPSAPTVARERAFGMIAVALAQPAAPAYVGARTAA